MHEDSKERNVTPEVADILRNGLNEYTSCYGRQPGHYWKVINALQNCRTSALGGHSYKCDTCDYSKNAYNSCRDRHCPKCQSLARLKWVQARLDELLPTEYFHAVFTVPAELNPFALRNKKAFYDLLHKSVAETMQELAADQKYLGADIGFISVLHTWGQNMMDHPHIHCIVPGGGLKDGKCFVKCRREFLFPFKVMARLFKGKLLAGFTRAVEKGDIRFNGNLRDYAQPSVWRYFLDSIYKKNWVTYCKPPFAGASQVLKYLGGYTHRIAISNNRILAMDNDSVTFRYRSYADGNQVKVMKLSRVEFIRRFLLHILPKGFRRIRYYGFLANCKRKTALVKCFEVLGIKEKASGNSKIKDKTGTAPTVIELFKSVFNVDLSLCPKCRGRLRPVFAGVRYSGGVFR
jgi:hypothetical protein